MYKWKLHDRELKSGDRLYFVGYRLGYDKIQEKQLNTRRSNEIYDVKRVRIVEIKEDGSLITRNNKGEQHGSFYQDFDESDRINSLYDFIVDINPKDLLLSKIIRK